METRSSRHMAEDISSKPESSRTNKNRYLYDEVNNGIGYGAFDGFSNGDNAKDLTIKKREDYHKTRNTDLIDNEVDKQEEDKVYDINSILEEAKKNRTLTEEEDKKRQFQKAEYNILEDLNQKYINKKEKIDAELENAGIRELIDTITSKSLPKDLLEAQKSEQEDDDKELMSDLMATSTMTALNDINLEEEIAKEILVEKEERDDDEADEIKKEDGRLVNSFYTRSMDLTEHDFDFRDDTNEERKEKRKIWILVILIALVILTIVALFVLKELELI